MRFRRPSPPPVALRAAPVCGDPPIFAAWRHGADPLGGVGHISERLGGAPLWWLVAAAWEADDEAAAEAFARAWFRHAGEAPHHRVIPLCRDDDVVEALAARGVPAALVDLDPMLDAAAFVLPAAESPRHGAVYAPARARGSWHALAAQVGSLTALCGPPTGAGPFASEAAADLRALLPHAEAIGVEDASGAAAVLGRAAVALCLSPDDGRAALACMLCGVPVVATERSGGRRFRHPLFTRIASAKPEAIAAAAAELAAVAVPRDAVRDWALGRIAAERQAWRALLREILLVHRAEAGAECEAPDPPAAAAVEPATPERLLRGLFAR